MTGDVDASLASIFPLRRECPQTLRAVVRAMRSDAVECMTHAMPVFRQAGLNGNTVAGYAAFTHHLGLYSHSGTVMPLLTDACKECKTSEIGILFTPQHPLPDELAHNIISARLAELAAGYGKRPRS